MTTQTSEQKPMAMNDIIDIINKSEMFVAEQQEEGENDTYIVRKVSETSSICATQRPFSNVGAIINLNYKSSVYEKGFNITNVSDLELFRDFSRKRELPLKENYFIRRDNVSRADYISFLEAQAQELNELATKMKEQR